MWKDDPKSIILIIYFHKKTNQIFDDEIAKFLITLQRIERFSSCKMWGIIERKRNLIIKRNFKK